MKDENFSNAAKDMILYLKKIKIPLTQAAIIVEEGAKKDCPVDTGNLRDSIDYDVKDDKAIVGTNVEYAPHVEYGTIKMKAKPFLRPAFDNNMTKIKNIFKKWLKSIK